jgi:hypothetical protein
MKLFKTFIILFNLSFIFFSCDRKTEFSSIKPINWEKRSINLSLKDSLIAGKTYVSVYSQIYSNTEHRTHDLTATVSMKNINLNDSVFIEQADYYDTKGRLIRTYFNKPIYILPLETVEIVIDEVDKEGGTGANFIFNWKIKPYLKDPHFESVMISTSGQQGLSFTSQGIKLK